MTGRLLLVPNALDLGSEAVALDEVLPAAVIRRAAALTHWVVEDARSARAFLKRVAGQVPLVQPLQALTIHELPRMAKGTSTAVPDAAWRELLAPALQGHDLGLLSEAGLPAVADPGAGLVAQAHALQIPVWPLPGPSSIALALAASGLYGQSFAFLGYLPQEARAREQRLRELEGASRGAVQTQLFIETPYRNAALLDAMLRVLAPSTRVSVACGLTLPDGFTRMGTVEQWRRSSAALPAKVPAVFGLLAT